jgi:hypothetical protein
VGWGNESTLFSNGTQLADLARVGPDDSGHAVVVLRAYAGSDYRFFGLRYTPGTGWGNATEIPTPGNTGIAWAPDLAVAGNGDALVGFYKYNSSLTNTWAAHFTPSGGWENATTIDASAYNSWAPRVGATPSGDFLAVFSSNNGAVDRAYGRWYRAGSGWAAAAQIDANNTTEAREPVVEVDSAGNAWAVWHTGTLPEDLNVTSTPQAWAGALPRPSKTPRGARSRPRLPRGVPATQAPYGSKTTARRTACTRASTQSRPTRRPPRSSS